jgi:hypothetical protein
MNSEIRAAIAIQTLIKADDPAASRQLEAATKRFGPRILDHVGQVSPLPVTKR